MQQRDSSPSDSVLVSAARAGDRDAFAVLFSRYRPMLIAVCRRWRGVNAPVDDVVQETALQALLSLDQLRQPERFGAWLTGIGLNICRRWSRAHSREILSWDDLIGGRLGPEPADSTADPEAAAEAALIRDAVRRAVAGLPPRQRAAVALFYLAGLTYAETAAALGTETGAVRTRLHNARKRLRRSLINLWQEEQMASQAEPNLVEVRIAGVWQKRIVEEPREWTASVVLLQEVAGERQLPVWIGFYEGMAMALLLEKVQPPRPLTYAFLADLLRATGAELQQVRITRLAEDTFYAAAIVAGANGVRSVDARPSDALNLALAMGAPIYVAEEVFGVAERQDEQRFAQPSAGPPRFAEQGWKDAAAIVTDHQQWMAAALESRRRRLGGGTAA